MRRIIHNGLKGLLLAFAVMISGAAAQTTHAAMGGLTLSPTSSDVTVAPGSSYDGKIIVLNQGSSATDYKVYATPYSVTGEEYKPYFSPIKGATDITKWFSFSNTGGKLATGERADIPYKITVPAGTGAGSYFATVFAETEDQGTSGVVTHKRLGMIVYLRVSGNVIEKGSIEQWSVPFLQEAPLKATVKIANGGSVHFSTKLQMTVSDVLGNPKYSYDRTAEILPQKLRAVPMTWQKGASFGIFKVSGKVTYLGKTEKLPERFVFVANTLMKLITIGVLLLLVASLVIMGRKRADSRKK